MSRGIGLYYMTYMSTDKGRGCGGSILATDGSISSPLYPEPYNIEGECMWQISVPGYHVVTLQLTNFALNSTVGCDTNYLEIYEGTVDDDSKRIVRYCGSDEPSSHELTSNDALIKLVTDATNNLPGFYLKFYSSIFVPETTSANFVQRLPSDD